MRREGKRTFFYEEGAWIRSRACMAGQKEAVPAWPGRRKRRGRWETPSTRF